MAIFDTEKYFNAQEAFNRTCKVKNEIMNTSLNEIYNNINTSIKLGSIVNILYSLYTPLNKSICSLIIFD